MSPATAETLLADALRRAWMAQSSGERRLAVTDEVREAVELAVAAGGGALEVAATLPDDAASPEDLIGRLRDWLPDRLDPWAARTLARLPFEPTGWDTACQPPRGIREVRPLAPPQEPPLQPADAPNGRAAEPAGRPPRRIAAAGGAAFGALLAQLARRRR